MYCAAPPVLGGNPIPMIEPMLAAAADSMTPSSKHFAVSSASAKSIRSFTSRSGGWSPVTGNASARPGHSPRRLPASSYS